MAIFLVILIRASLSEPHIDELNVRNLYIIIITRNELALLAHSFTPLPSLDPLPRTTQWIGKGRNYHKCIYSCTPMRMLVENEFTVKGRLLHKFVSGLAINQHWENLVSLAVSTIVGVPLQAEVKNTVAIHRQGWQSRTFFLVLFGSLTTAPHAHV